MILLPKNRAIIVPKAINGPKGMGSLSPLFLINMTIPIMAPVKKLRNRESRVNCQPKKAPTIAANLISPPPIASFLNKKLPKMATNSNTPPPAKIPSKELMGDKFFRKKLIRKPRRSKGRDKTSGIMFSFKSMKVIIIKAEQKNI